MNNRENINYELAQERVKKLKNFYKSLTIFLFVITAVAIIKFYKYGFENLGNLKISAVFIVWGIILAVKAAKLFFFNSDWERDMINKELKKHNDGNI